jgi:excisionase family DNA binding protein
VKEAAAILGVGRNTAYEAIKRNEIPSVRIGRRLVVPRGALEQLLAARREPSGLSVEPKPVLGPQL